MRSLMEAASAEIFDYIDRHPDREFVLRVSAVEIYNEVVRDLLK
jgi:centromeric protein E